MPGIERTPARGVKQSGFTLTELVVASTLLVAIMGIVAPLTVRSGWLWQEVRHQQLAMDALSNQLERLIALEPEQRERAIAELAVPEHLSAAIPSAVITAEAIHDQHGKRLVLSLSWDRYGAPSAHQPPLAPITLVGWLDPMPGPPASREDVP